MNQYQRLNTDNSTLFMNHPTQSTQTSGNGQQGPLLSMFMGQSQNSAAIGF